MDTPTLITIIASIVALGLGYVIAIVITKSVQKNKAAEILKKAEEEGEITKEKKILQAKEKFIQLKSEHDKFVNEKNKSIADTENRLKQKEQQLTNKTEDYKRKETEIENIKKDILDQKEILEKRRQDVEKLHIRQVQQLEALSNLSKEDAKAQLVEALKAEAKTNALSYIQEIMEEAK
jgi:ribonuclease Y